MPTSLLARGEAPARLWPEFVYDAEKNSVQIRMCSLTTKIPPDYGKVNRWGLDMRA
jgi:hypothetical protein